MKTRFDWILAIFLGFMIACWFGYQGNQGRITLRPALAADTKITGLTAATTAEMDTADLLAMVNDPGTTAETLKATIAQVLGAHLADIRGLSITTNELIMYNGTHFSDFDIGTGLAVSGATFEVHPSLIDIANVTATTGDIMYWDGSDWVKLILDTDDTILAVGTTVPVMKALGTGLSLSDTNLELAAVLRDIVAITASTGDMLFWNGSDWVQFAIAATDEYYLKCSTSGLEWGAGAADGDTLGALTATTGDMTYWTGTTWEVLVLDTDDTIITVGTDIPVLKAIGTGIVIQDATVEVAAVLIDIVNITASTGDLLYWNGSDWVQLALGAAGYLLEATTSGIGWINNIGIGTIDMGSGIVELPQGTAVANDGEVNFDFTDGSFVVQHGAAHAELGASTDVVMAKLIHSFHGVYLEPDSIQAVIDNAPLVGIFSAEFPHGIVITDIIVCKADTAQDIALNIEKWTTLLTINATTSTIDAIVLTTGEEQHHEDTITFDDLNPDCYICVDLGTDDIPAFTIGVLYYEPIS